jgi:hypothetical protein
LNFSSEVIGLLNRKIIGKQRKANRYLMSSVTCDCDQDGRKIRQKSDAIKLFLKRVLYNFMRIFFRKNQGEILTGPRKFRRPVISTQIILVNSL